MGDKQPSVRTLSTGEKVTHYPDGTQIMVPTNNRAERVHNRQQELEDAHSTITARHLDAVAAKRASYAAGDPVPHDKRSI